MADLLDEDAAACRAGAVLSRLAALGVQAGDRIAVLAGNGPGLVAARDAATAADLVLVPINPRLAPTEVAWIAGHARPRALVVDQAHRAAAPGDVPLIELDALPADTAAPIDHAKVGATLLYTSGTTGRPKGCWRTAEQERARADELRASYALSAHDTHLIVCPLGHSAPGIFLRAARAAGARTVIAPRFTAESFVAHVQHHRATVVFLVPTQVHRLLALDPPPRIDSLRAVIVAGAPFPPAQKAAFDAWLGHGRLYEFYGSSETGTVSVIGPDEHAAHPGSVGRPPPGVSVQLHDGELFVRSPTVMSGYLDDTGEHVAPLADRDGHISVGDLGTIDDDGWITLVDRKHDTIITGGVNVYPAEVERALAALPEVAGAVVFGVPDPDWGQLVAAVIATRDGARLDAAHVRASLRDHLAGYKLPRALATCTLDELPIGASGKALRRAAREAFASRLQRVDRAG